MKTIPVFFDEDLLEEINRIVSESSLTVTDIVQDAVRSWLRKKESRNFETEWIEKLRQCPDDSQDAEKWLAVDEWSREGRYLAG